MFQDLDATLKALLLDPAAPEFLRDADVSFDTPDKDYKPAQATVNLFLHEVTENRTLRDEARVLERAGSSYRARLPSLRVDCTYLTTAWSSRTAGMRAAEEHRLLGLALVWLSRFPVIDERFLQGTLQAPSQPYPLPTVVAQTREGQAMGHFWSALGVPPRPAFSLTVTITVDPFDQVEEFAAVQGAQLRTASPQYPALAGRVLDHTLTPVPGATVTVTETGDQVTSGRDGGFAVAGLGFGAYHLRVQAADHPDRQVSVNYAAEAQIHDVVLPAH
ncbi:Pvc16 family protein [Nonomuraea sp. NPDC003707]